MAMTIHSINQPTYSRPNGLHVSAHVLLEALLAFTLGVLFVVAALTGFGVLPLAWLDFAVVATSVAAICYFCTLGYMDAHR